jgi:amino-acid N-acetyltransferase
VTTFRIRPGVAADAEALDALIRSHQAEGHLLPRDLGEIRRRVDRFTVCDVNGTIRACVELAPLSAAVAEVRSLVVSEDIRGAGVASGLLDAVRIQASENGHDTLCALTHDPRFFVRQNFSIVPHEWLPEKIARDCAACPLFRRCGQHAMVLPLKEIARYVIDDVEECGVAVA